MGNYFLTIALVVFLISIGIGWYVLGYSLGIARVIQDCTTLSGFIDNSVRYTCAKEFLSKNEGFSLSL